MPLPRPLPVQTGHSLHLRSQTHRQPPTKRCMFVFWGVQQVVGSLSIINMYLAVTEMGHRSHLVKFRIGLALAAQSRGLCLSCFYCLVRRLICLLRRIARCFRLLGLCSLSCFGFWCHDYCESERLELECDCCMASSSLHFVLASKA